MRVDGLQRHPFVFCSNAPVAKDGTIYFSDSSTKFGFEHWRADLLEHRSTGRLFRRDTVSNLDVLADGLAFAYGVALAADESIVVVAETAGYRPRVWLTRDRVGATEVQCSQGSGQHLDRRGRNIWVAIASARDSTLDLVLPRWPALRKVVWTLPQRFQPQPKSLVHIQAFAAGGSLAYDIAGKHDRFGKPTCARQVGTKVWLGSFEQTTLAVMDLPWASGADRSR